MNIPTQMAKHYRHLISPGLVPRCLRRGSSFFGGNWTDSNLKDQLSDLDWKMATTKVYSLNTIAGLVYHIHYFVNAILKVLHGGPLDAHDKFSYDCAPIESQKDWEGMLSKVWAEAEEFAKLVEQLPESKVWELFSQEKYSSYYRNIQGIIEHSHYHLGQIAVIKKILMESKK